MRPPTLPTIVTMGGIVVVHNAGELILNKRTNGPVNACLRPEIYTNKPV